MRNRALHDALRDFALEAASLLTDELRDGAEIEFDVLDEGGGRGPALYRYRPRTAEFVAARWEGLRALPACSRAAAELGTGASLWLRVNGMAGERAEPALRAMLERLYEDATSFGFPEQRFERLYEEVERTLYAGLQRTCVAVPLRGVELDCERVDFGAAGPGAAAAGASGLAAVGADRGGESPQAAWAEDGAPAGTSVVTLVRGDRAQLPPEAAWAEDGAPPEAVVLVERDTSPDEPIPALEAEAAAARIVTAMRLLRPGAATISPIAWRRTDAGRWSALALAGGNGAAGRADAEVARRGPAGLRSAVVGPGRGEPWTLADDDADELRDLVRILTEDPLRGASAWALRRFELGCAHPSSADAISDYLLALRSLLDASSDAGEASLALRVAALCAEEGQRRAVQRRVELAVALERFAMQGGGHLDAELREQSAPELVAELEGYLRALLRDIVCGYLDPDLKGVADDILLEAREPFEIAARDMRADAAEPKPAAHGSDARRDAAAHGEPPGEHSAYDDAAAAHGEPPGEHSAYDDAAAAHGEPPGEHSAYDDAETAEVPALAAGEQQTLDGVTPSADWGFGDPQDFSAPI